MSVNVTTSQGNTVDVSVSGGNTVSFTQTSTSVSVSSPSVSSIVVTEKGPKGDTGATGATGPQGPTGATGAAGTTFTAGDGLDLTTGTLSTDLKSNGGLVIESNKLAVDLGASSITGTLAISDGGTGSTSTTYCALGSNVSGTLPVANGGTGSTSLTDNQILVGNGTSAVSHSADLTFDGNTFSADCASIFFNSDSFTLKNDSGSSTNEPKLTIHATDNNGSSGVLEFFATRGNPDISVGDPSDNDDLGRILFKGHDDGTPSETEYADIIGEIGDASDGQETGKLTLNVATNTGPPLSASLLKAGLILEGGNDQGGSPIGDNTVNATIGFGSSSVTTITGDLSVTGTASVTETLAIGSSSDIEPKITLTNDENSVEIGVANGSNDMVNGSQDGDLVINSVGDHQIILAQNDTSCARLDTDGKFVGVPILVDLSRDDVYLTYLSGQNVYYSFGAIALSFSTSIGSELDSSAIRGCSFIAPYACTVKRVTMAFYITSGPSDLEFYFGKVPLVDDSTANVTILQITATDHDGSYNANENYVKTFDLSGPNAILSEGHGLAVFARRTDSGSLTIIYGNAFADIRIN